MIEKDMAKQLEWRREAPSYTLGRSAPTSYSTENTDINRHDGTYLGARV
jgi:hypothetical protein